MEDALYAYFTTYEEFKKYFYWSSSAGKRKPTWGEFEYQQSELHARATKAFEDGGYAESGGDSEDDYTTESGTTGRALRTQPLRIRAFRTDLDPVK